MKNISKYIGLGLFTMLAMTACSDKFLEDKTNYDNVGEAVYDDFNGANGRLNDIYAMCLPDVNAGIAWNNPSTGDNDMAGKSTEEYSGFSIFVDPLDHLTVDGAGGSRVPDFFDNENKVRENVYGRIRNINDIIRGVEKGSMSQEDKDIILGQCYFFRGWCYYNLFKWYGGVPLVTEVLEPVASNFTPRSSARATYELIINDLNTAATLLAAKTGNEGWDANNWGRVTSGTALALKGRAMLWWCSPIFNRKNDPSRWQTAYETMKEDLAVINSCGYHLYQSGSNVNGSDFAAQFLQDGKNPEAVFVTLYNKFVGESNTQKNSNWERYIRPYNTTGTPGKEASAMLVDMFPMKDGRIPAGTGTYTKLTPSTEAYDNKYPFVNRDPRFYRTFAFPGVRWTFDGNPSAKDPNFPSSGTDYELWNYFWYASAGEQGDIEGKSYAADYLSTNGRGIYVRKRSDDKDLGTSPLYSFDASAKVSGFQYSGAPYLELRYAEVLLNLAEVACAAGHPDEAREYVNQVRRRAGVPDLTSSDYNGEGGCMSAILYERQIEFAYEGKRFDDLRRWMLYDGGVGQESISSNYTLTGWGGNTCTYLGFTQLNGQRRDNMQFRVNDNYGLGTELPTGDPLVKAGVERCAALNYKTDDLDAQTAVLQNWYSTHLTRKRTLGDGRDENKVELKMNFRPYYYIIGFCSRAQNENKQLPQTVGWEDYNKRGTMGTFDPLAE